MLATLCVALGLAGCDSSSMSYVHVVAHLMHGDEPVTLDWVGQCRFRKRGGEMRAYVQVTVAPYVYGVATRDGGMVLAEAPAYCGNGKPPESYLPLFFWGDKAGDFSFLTAYVTDEAFSNPASKLKVLDVTLSSATEAERDAFKKTGTKNIVPIGQRNPFLRRWDEKPYELSVTCGGYEQIPVLPAVKALVDAEWPADRPLYWKITDELYKKMPDQYYRTISDNFIRNIDQYLSEGTSLKIGSKKAFMHDDNIYIPSGVFDVVPIGFDFFRNEDLKVYDLKRQIKIPRPHIINAEVNEEHNGIIYCGIFPFFFDYIDNIYNINFRSDKITGRYLSGIMKSDTIMYNYFSFGFGATRKGDDNE